MGEYFSSSRFEGMCHRGYARKVHLVVSKLHHVHSLLKWQGVMMTHANIDATTARVMTSVPNMSSNDTYLAYLPLAHGLELAAEVNSL